MASWLKEGITEVEREEADAAVGAAQRGSVGAAQAAEDEEQLGAIVQTLQCLSANVEEARTFLGKMGKTKEGAYDASVTQLASDEVSCSQCAASNPKLLTRSTFTPPKPPASADPR